LKEIPMRRCLSLLAALLCTLSLAHAAQFRYVHGDSPCPGDGTDTAPYCRIQSAVDAAQCGDTIRIRATAQPYTEQVNITKPSCPPQTPVFLEPDRYQEIRWQPQKTQTSDWYGLQLLDVDGWVVRGLTLEGSPGQPRYGLLVQAYSRSVSGIVLAGNRVLDWNVPTRWGNSAAIHLQGRPSTGAVVEGALVTNNQIVGFRKVGLQIMNSVRGRYLHNDISGGRCGPETQGDLRTAIVQGIAVTAQTIPSVAPAFGDEIAFNRLHDFQTRAECMAELGPEGMTLTKTYGISCDEGPTDAWVHHNQIDNVSPLEGSHVRGIWVEARCHRWRLEDNTLRDIGAYAIHVYGQNFDVHVERNVIERPRKVCIVLGPGPVSQGPAKRRVVRSNTCIQPGQMPFLSESDLVAEEDVIENNSWQTPAP
jgi:hypothetical protein